MPPRATAPAKVKHLTEDELAERLGLTVAAVKKWRREDRGPDYLKGEGEERTATVRYPVAWVEEWENSRRVRMTA